MPRSWKTLLGLAPVAAGLIGCRAEQFPQSTLHPRSDFAWAIQDLFTGIFWWAVVVFVVVEGILLYAVFRYRARPGAPPPRPVHGHTLLEIAWTLAPALVLVLIAVPTIRTIFHTAGKAPPGALRVEVVGHQWWWEFRYPELGIVTANELHLPVGRPVALELTSADVIHSFWAPALGGKRDVILSRTNRIALTADSEGVYLGQCAEFCGASHANMRLRVVVQSDSGFAAWVAAQRAGPVAPAPGTLEERGRQAYARSACIACHTVQGVSAGRVGPDLTHLGSRQTIASGLFANTPENLARWIEDAPALKPGSLMPKMVLTPEDRDAIVAYLRSLR
ncbi:MAG TPA: cytochrome c oxidase subunit II [Gemmatimonadales bacterium]|nr:cytochrome c oxidase subunit II [Gemmatimonadales bacterium]